MLSLVYPAVGNFFGRALNVWNVKNVFEHSDAAWLRVCSWSRKDDQRDIDVYMSLFLKFKSTFYTRPKRR